MDTSETIKQEKLMRLEINSSWLIALISLAFACNDSKNSEEPIFQSPKIISYQGENNLYNWENNITANDTAIIQTFFDTSYYDKNEVINTIAYSIFNEKVPKYFDFDKYINHEKLLIHTSFELIKDGAIKSNLPYRHWFIIKTKDAKSYIEYVYENPIFIKTISTSNHENYMDELNHLNVISNQFRKPKLPNRYKKI